MFKSLCKIFCKCEPTPVIVCDTELSRAADQLRETARAFNRALAQAEGLGLNYNGTFAPLDYVPEPFGRRVTIMRGARVSLGNIFHTVSETKRL